MAYVHNAPWYYAKDGTPVQAVATEEGWTYPQAPVDDDGAQIRVIDDPATVAQLNTQALGFNPDDKVVNPDQSVSIMNPQTQQYEQAVAAGESGALMPVSMAQAQNLPIYQYAQEPKETNQLADFGGTLAQLAAMGAGAYGVGSLLGGGLAGAGEFGATVADGLGASDVASYVAPKAGTVDLSFLSDPAYGYQNLVTDPVLGSGVNAAANTAANQLMPGALVNLANSGSLLTGVGAAGAASGLGGAIDWSGQGAADDAAMGQTYTEAGGTIPQGSGAGGVYTPGIGGAAAGTALSRILGGTGTAADWTSVLGNVAGAGLGAYASNQQAGKLEELAGKYFDLGAPSRGRYEASMTPGFDPSTIPGYQGAVDNSMQAMLRKLSTQGNPFSNPGGLIEANKAVVAGTALPALQAYQGANAASGGFGTYNAAAPGATQASLGANNNFYNAIGGGIANLANPRSSLEDLLRRYSGGGSTALA